MHSRSTVKCVGRLLPSIMVAALVCGSGARARSDPLGATPHAASVTFRVWAPFVDAVAVKVDGTTVPMTQESGHPDAADTVWTADVPGVVAGARYRYVMQVNGASAEFHDPRARQLTGHDASAFSIVVDPGTPPPPFQTPNFNEMVIYELHVGSFNPTASGQGTFARAVKKLDYLKDLGINAVELMPLHENAPGAGHTPASFDWGYDPVTLFAIEESYGSPEDLKTFVTEAHARGIGVIVDVVYNHLVGGNLLERFGGFAPPSVKDGVYFYPDGRVDTGFGPRPDYGRPQVRDYIVENALMWLRDYGADGLRWDSTINIRAQSDPNVPIPDGERLIRDANDAYRSTDPKQPQKIAIAEDLQSAAAVDAPTSDLHGLGFNSQWEESLFYSLRRAVFTVDDRDRNIGDVAAAIGKRVGPDAFNRVVFSENHDKVGHPAELADGKPQIRLPALIDEHEPESVFAKKRSTLAAAIVLTAPGIPMLFQGQEMLETRAFDFVHAVSIDWTRPAKFPGIIRMYHDLIALRRNLAGKTAGLTGQGLNVFRVDDQAKLLAYHRFGAGGPGDDVVVVANFANRPANVSLSFPRAGPWVVRFNSGAAVYDPAFTDGDSFDATAAASDHDEHGLAFAGNVGVGPYSVVVLSQD